MFFTISCAWIFFSFKSSFYCPLITAKCIVILFYTPTYFWKIALLFLTSTMINLSRHISLYRVFFYCRKAIFDDIKTGDIYLSIILEKNTIFAIVCCRRLHTQYNSAMSMKKFKPKNRNTAHKTWGITRARISKSSIRHRWQKLQDIANEWKK